MFFANSRPNNRDGAAWIWRVLLDIAHTVCGNEENLVVGVKEGKWVTLMFQHM